MRVFAGPAPAAAAVLTCTFVVVAACGGGSGSTPTPSLTVPPVESGEPTPPPPDTAYRFVYREFGATQDTVWRVNPADPSQREQLAVIEHREGWGVKPALSPDGKLLAYLSQPDFALSGDSSQAEAYVLELASGEKTLVARDIDLNLTPLWSPDGAYIYLRRLAGPEFLAADVMILRVTVPRKPKEGEATPTATPAPAPETTPNPEPNVHVAIRDSIAHVLTFIPIGFSGDGKTMYFVQVEGGTVGGTLLGAFDIAAAEAQWALEGQPTPPPGAGPPPAPPPLTKLVAELSDQIARDFDLSPDANKVSFVAQELVQGRFMQRAYVTDLISTTTTPVSFNGLPVGDHLRPQWHPDSARLALGVLPDSGGSGAVALVSVGGGVPSFLAEPRSGYDLPQAWAPDGTYLAVTNFSGRSLVDPGTAILQVIAAESGQRLTVGPGADIEILGWSQPAPAAGPAPS